MTYTFRKIDSPFSVNNNRLEGAIFDDNMYLSGYFQIDMDDDSKSVILSRGGDTFIASQGELVINGEPASDDVKVLLQQLTVFSPREDSDPTPGGTVNWGDIEGSIHSQSDLWSMVASGTGITVQNVMSTGKVIVNHDGSASWGKVSGDLSTQADLWGMILPGANISLEKNATNNTITINATGEIGVEWGTIGGDITTQTDIWDMLVPGDDSIHIERDVANEIIKIRATGGGAGGNGSIRLTKADEVTDSTYTEEEVLVGDAIVYELHLPDFIQIDGIKDVFFMSSSIADGYMKSLNYAELVEIDNPNENCIYVAYEESEQYDVILINGNIEGSTFLSEVLHDETLVGEGTLDNRLGLSPSYLVKNVVAGANITATNVEGTVTIAGEKTQVIDNLTTSSPTSALSAKQGVVLLGLIDDLIGSAFSGPYATVADIPTPYENNIYYLVGPTGSGGDTYEEYVLSDGQLLKIGDTTAHFENYYSKTQSEGVFVVKDSTTLNTNAEVHLNFTPIESTNTLRISMCHSQQALMQMLSIDTASNAIPIFSVYKDGSFKSADPTAPANNFFGYEHNNGVSIDTVSSAGQQTWGKYNFQSAGTNIDSTEVLTPSKFSMNDFKVRSENRGQGASNKMAIDDSKWKVKDIVGNNHVTATGVNGTWTIGHDGYKTIDYVANLFLVTNPESYTLPDPTTYEMGTVLCAVVEGPNSFYHPRAVGSYNAVAQTYRLSDPYANQIWPWNGEGDWRNNPRVPQSVRDKGVRRIGYLGNYTKTYTTGMRYNMIKCCYWNQYTDTYPNGDTRTYTGPTASDGVRLEAIRLANVGAGNYCTAVGHSAKQIDVRDNLGRNYTSGWGQLNKHARFVLFDDHVADNSGNNYVFRCDEDAMTGAYTKSIAWGSEINSGIGDYAVLHLMDDTYYSFKNLGSQTMWLDVATQACINIEDGYIPYKWYYIGLNEGGTAQVWKQYWPDLGVNDTTAGVVIPALPDKHSILGQWEKAHGLMYMTQGITSELASFAVSYTERTSTELPPVPAQTTVSAGSNIIVTATGTDPVDYQVKTTFSVDNSLASTSVINALSALQGKNLFEMIGDMETRAWKGPYANVPAVPTPYSNQFIYLVGGSVPYDMYVLVDSYLAKLGDTSVNLSEYYTKTQIDTQWTIKNLQNGAGSIVVSDNNGLYHIDVTTRWNDIVESTSPNWGQYDAGNLKYLDDQASFYYMVSSGIRAGLSGLSEWAFFGIGLKSGESHPYVGVFSNSGAYARILNSQPLSNGEQVPSWGDFDQSMFSIDTSTGKIVVAVPDEAAWGNITGDIANQTDLVAAFDDYYKKTEYDENYFTETEDGKLTIGNRKYVPVSHWEDVGTNYEVRARRQGNTVTVLVKVTTSSLTTAGVTILAAGALPEEYRPEVITDQVHPFYLDMVVKSANNRGSAVDFRRLDGAGTADNQNIQRWSGHVILQSNNYDYRLEPNGNLVAGDYTAAMSLTVRVSPDGSITIPADASLPSSKNMYTADFIAISYVIKDLATVYEEAGDVNWKDLSGYTVDDVEWFGWTHLTFTMRPYEFELDDTHVFHGFRQEVGSRGKLIAGLTFTKDSSGIIREAGALEVGVEGDAYTRKISSGHFNGGDSLVPSWGDFSHDDFEISSQAGNKIRIKGGGGLTADEVILNDGSSYAKKNLGKTLSIAKANDSIVSIHNIGYPLSIFKADASGNINASVFFMSVTNGFTYYADGNSTQSVIFNNVSGLSVRSSNSSQSITIGAVYNLRVSDMDSNEVLTPARMHPGDFALKVGAGNYNKIGINGSTWKVKDLTAGDGITIDKTTNPANWTISASGGDLSLKADKCYDYSKIDGFITLDGDNSARRFTICMDEKFIEQKLIMQLLDKYGDLGQPTGTTIFAIASFGNSVHQFFLVFELFVHAIGEDITTATLYLAMSLGNGDMAYLGYCNLLSSYIEDYGFDFSFYEFGPYQSILDDYFGSGVVLANLAAREISVEMDTEQMVAEGYTLGNDGPLSYYGFASTIADVNQALVIWAYDETKLLNLSDAFLRIDALEDASISLGAFDKKANKFIEAGWSNLFLYENRFSGFGKIVRPSWRFSLYWVLNNWSWLISKENLKETSSVGFFPWANGNACVIHLFYLTDALSSANMVYFGIGVYRTGISDTDIVKFRLFFGPDLEEPKAATIDYDTSNNLYPLTFDDMTIGEWDNYFSYEISSNKNTTSLDPSLGLGDSISWDYMGGDSLVFSMDGPLETDPIPFAEYKTLFLRTDSTASAFDMLSVSHTNDTRIGIEFYFKIYGEVHDLEDVHDELLEIESGLDRVGSVVENGCWIPCESVSILMSSMKYRFQVPEYYSLHSNYTRYGVYKIIFHAKGSTGHAYWEGTIECTTSSSTVPVIELANVGVSAVSSSGSTLTVDLSSSIGDVETGKVTCLFLVMYKR